MPTVNNVTRFLDAKKVKYTAFETPAEKLGALETARILNIPPEQVFKTIVVTRPKPGKPVLAVIPGTGQVDLKLTAAALGEKKVGLPTEKEAEGLTGLQAGGISPLALINKGFQVLIDVSAQKFPPNPRFRRPARTKFGACSQRPGRTDARALCADFCFIARVGARRGFADCLDRKNPPCPYRCTKRLSLNICGAST
jgi:Cys-tRNA(Pro)/Cys-tRNA(Cys) deacylase